MKRADNVDGYDAFTGNCKRQSIRGKISTGKPPTRDDVMNKLAPMLMKSAVPAEGWRSWAGKVGYVHADFQHCAPESSTPRSRPISLQRVVSHLRMRNCSVPGFTQMIKLYPPKAKKGSSDGR